MHQDTKATDGTHFCSLTMSVPFTRSTSRIQMLQASSHMKSCIEDEALEDLHREGGGGDHVYSFCVAGEASRDTKGVIFLTHEPF
jgi:hypothetical protein